MIILPYKSKYRFQLVLCFILTFSLAFTSCKTKQKSTEIKQTKASVKASDEVEFTRRYLEALDEKLLGNYKQAIELFLYLNNINPGNYGVNYQLGEILTITQNFDQAEDFAATAFKIDPNNYWGALLYAGILEKNLKLKEAEVIYRKLLESRPREQAFLQNLLNVLSKQKKHLEAIKILDKWENINGIAEELYIERYNLFNATGKTKEALEQLEKAALLFPENAGTYLGMIAQTYEEQGKKDKAVAFYEKVLEVEPDNPLIHLALADFYRNKGDNAKSFEYLKTAFENPKVDIDTKMKILLAYFETSQIFPSRKKEMDELFAIMEKVHPNDSKTKAFKGDLLLIERKYEEALSLFKEIVEMGNNQYIFRKTILDILYEQKKWEELIIEAEKVIELHPTVSHSYYLKGFAHSKLKQHEKAIKTWKLGYDLISYDPTAAGTFLLSIAMECEIIKDFECSDKHFNELIELNPNDHLSLNNYAYFLSLRKENLEKALLMSKKANELLKNSASYQDTYGWILYQLGDYNNALEWLLKAEKNGGANNAVILEHIGDTYLKLNNRPKAQSYWEKALELDPENETLKNKLNP